MRWVLRLLGFGMCVYSIFFFGGIWFGNSVTSNLPETLTKNEAAKLLEGTWVSIREGHEYNDGSIDFRHYMYTFKLAPTKWLHGTSSKRVSDEEKPTKWYRPYKGDEGGDWAVLPDQGSSGVYMRRRDGTFDLRLKWDSIYGSGEAEDASRIANQSPKEFKRFTGESFFWGGEKYIKQ